MERRSLQKGPVGMGPPSVGLSVSTSSAQSLSEGLILRTASASPGQTASSGQHLWIEWI